MDRSVFLARLLGVPVVILSVAMALEPDVFKAVLDSFFATPSALYFAGIASLVAGLAMILTHNVWVWSWRVIVTLLGWIMFVRGIAVMCLPNMMISVGHTFTQPDALHAVAGFDLLLGLVLCYFGFFSREEAAP